MINPRLISQIGIILERLTVWTCAALRASKTLPCALAPPARLSMYIERLSIPVQAFQRHPVADSVEWLIILLRHALATDKPSRLDSKVISQKASVPAIPVSF